MHAQYFLRIIKTKGNTATPSKAKMFLTIISQPFFPKISV